MYKVIFYWVLMLSCVAQLSAQKKQITFCVYDQISKEPISDAHAFILNTQIGSSSNNEGKIELDLFSEINESMIISHIGYDNYVLSYDEYILLTKVDSVFMSPNGIDISTILLTAKRDNKWKKQYRKFKNAFLGKGLESKKCTILNPEVLRFETKEDLFLVSAIDAIKIKNEYLGYHLDFVLTEFEMAKSGSIKYKGYSKFTDLEKEDDYQVQKRRLQCFQKNPRHFYRSLVQDQLKSDGYELRICRYEQGRFETIAQPTRNTLVIKDSISNLYHLQFPEFLQITNRNVKDVEFQNTGSWISAQEKQKFGSAGKESKSKISSAISQLYKLAPFLIIDKYGHVLNNEKVQEYGYWADRKIATTLPFEYEMELNSEIVIKERFPAEADFQDHQDALSLLKKLIYEPQNFDLHLASLENDWDESYYAPLIEISRVINVEKLEMIFKLISGKAGIQINNYYQGLQWLWKQEPSYESYYAEIKAEVHKNLDPVFEDYFVNRGATAKIRLDEIVWGGVKQDGIPPLRNPEMISIEDASYLGDDDVIFGIVINGEAKAFPKRILAWHEFFVKDFGSNKIAGVFCTLCGTVIAYDMESDGILHDLGTSGFLYRSNKLMYDKATQSLWNTIEGTPVLGSLSRSNIKLKTYPVITTDWKTWKNQYPDSQVLSLETGFQRDYSEGAAYREYFDTDKLMFPVPLADQRLKNKDEVLVIRSNNYERDPLAISIKYLKNTFIHSDVIAENNIIVLADANGAARVYDRKENIFVSYDDGKLKDNDNNSWIISEDYLTSKKGEQLSRIPSHNIFWFAWYNSYPNTRLVK